jgi:hypothetical protein
MTGLAQCLPVILIPEQVNISAVRLYVIYNRGNHNSFLLITNNAKRMFPKIPFPCSLPSRIISALTCGSAPIINLLPLLPLVLLASAAVR